MGEDVSDIKSGTDDADYTDMWYPFFGYDRNEPSVLIRVIRA